MVVQALYETIEQSLRRRLYEPKTFEAGSLSAHTGLGGGLMNVISGNVSRLAENWLSHLHS